MTDRTQHINRIILSLVERHKMLMQGLILLARAPQYHDDAVRIRAQMNADVFEMTEAFRSASRPAQATIDRFKRNESNIGELVRLLRAETL